MAAVQRGPKQPPLYGRHSHSLLDGHRRKTGTQVKAADKQFSQICCVEAQRGEEVQRRYPGRRDGTRQNHHDDRAHYGQQTKLHLQDTRHCSRQRPQAVGDPDQSVRSQFEGDGRQ